MANPFLTHKQQLLWKVQAVAGTFEALAAADGKTRLVVGDVGEYQAPKNERNIARASLTKRAPVGGTKALGFALRSEINTPDLITDALEYAPGLLAAGHTLTQARRIPIGAITSGPIPRNATMTGGTSGATGRVWRDATTGDEYIYFVPITGTFQAEALTFTGGASATSSAVSAAWGWSMRPTDPGTIVSLRLEEDGFIWCARDAMTSIAMEFENAKQGFIDFDVLGVRHLIQAAAMTTGIDFDDEDPPVMYDADLRLGSYVPVVSKWNFEQSLNLVLRGDGNAAGNTGLRGARGSTRDPKIVVTYEHVDHSVFDPHALHDSSTPIAFRARQGTVPGKSFYFFGDEAVVDGVSLPEQDGGRMAEVTLKLQSATDNGEYEAVWA